MLIIEKAFFRTISYVLTLFVVIGNQSSYAQFSLPNSKVLQENNINVVHISKTPLRMENPTGEDITEKNFDTTELLLTSHFFNALGKIDSSYHYAYGDSAKFNKVVYTYSEKQSLTEIKTFGSDNQLIQQTLLDIGSEGEMLLRTWQKGKLVIEKKISSDSIIYESSMLNLSNTTGRKFIRSYELQKDLQIEATYNQGALAYQETFQWIIKDGLPISFLYTEYKGNSTREKEKIESYVLKVAEDGSVINKLNGLFTDPFSSFNYYNRHERFTGIKDPNERLLSLEELIYEKESSELYKFDGTDKVFLYRFYYD